MTTFLTCLIIGATCLISFALLVEWIDKKFTQYLRNKKQKSNNYYQPKI